MRAIARRAVLLVWGLAAVAAVGACPQETPAVDAGDPYAAAREQMVARQIEGRGVEDARVLAALRRVPRHAFVPRAERPFAYEDRPLRIGAGQTISQPYIVALMTELAAVGPDARVLEVGTGSGYQAAVLGELAREVWSVEIVPELAREAEATLRAQGYRNVHVRAGDGWQGDPAHAPFDAIVVTAAPPEIPPPLLDQLAVGGRLVIPVGDYWQELVVVTRTPSGYVRRAVVPVAFVPMTGEAQRRR